MADLTRRQKYNKNYHAAHRNEINLRHKNARINNLQKHRDRDKVYDLKRKDQKQIYRDGRKAHTAKERHRYTVKRYGLTPEAYAILLEAQLHKCALCKKPTRELKSKLCVDHDHRTGRVRGLLCRPCNLWLMHDRDTVEALQNAIDYLTKG